MQITAIKQQIKRQDRYSIYIDGVYVLSLSESELLGTGIRLRQELTTNELRTLKERSVTGKAYDRALNLISHRFRSEWEIRDYLNRKDYDEAVVQEVLERLQARGYINDQQFAERWIENRRLLKPVSKRRLQQELRQKRIDLTIIEDALRSDEADEPSVLRELVARKRKQTKYRDDTKLMQYLARQGFSYDDIKTALRKTESD